MGSCLFSVMLLVEFPCFLKMMDESLIFIDRRFSVIPEHTCSPGPGLHYDILTFKAAKSSQT